MADIDEDRMELLERRLAEKVTARVRPALFRLYATAGVAVITVLAFVNWDIINDTKSEIKAEIAEDVEAEVRNKRVEILKRITEVDFMSERANKIILAVEKQLDDFQPQAENLEDTIQKVKELNTRSQNLLALYSQQLEPLITHVESLSRQLKTLAEQVDQLNMITSAGDAAPVAAAEPLQAPAQRADAIQSVISETQQAQQRLVEARNTTTVFFQYAGGPREQAEAIAAALQAEDYNVPGQDRERGAERKHEVRYFHEDDRNAAQRLAEDTTRTLRRLGFPQDAVPDIELKSLISYGGKKPRAGVLELWLDIPDI